MDGRCERHQFEAAIGICEFCGEEFCGECLVRPFGQKRPPYCIPCTISQSGLRSGATQRRRKLTRKERKEKAEVLSQNDAVVPAVMSASEAALRSAGKPKVHVSDESVEGKGKRGLRGKRKEKASAKTTAEVPQAGAPMTMPSISPVEEAWSQPDPSPSPAQAGEGEIPTGVGMAVPGAEGIDWSKPFEVKS